MALTNEKVQHVAKDLLPEWMLAERTRVLSMSPSLADTHNAKAAAAGASSSSVVYWMQRDVRTADNWALLLAAHLAVQKNVPLRVVYALPPPPSASSATTATAAAAAASSSTLDDAEGNVAVPSLVDLPMTVRHGKFLLGGLECVHSELKELQIPLHVIMAPSHAVVGETVCQTLMLPEFACDTVVTDFSPLRHHREWMELQAAPLLQNADKGGVAFYQVDAHNVVPVWMASDKREYGARTIRPKIHKQYAAYLQKFPKLKEFFQCESSSQEGVELPEFNRTVYEDFMKMDASVGELEWAKPGTAAGLQQAQLFFDKGLSKFDTLRNDPNHRNICSNLSPWINHGHVSFQRLAMAVKKLNKHANGTAAYMEEGIVRRELSDNFCYYDPNRYDSIAAAYDWAQETLRVHASDPREYVYTVREFERGETHDDLWNAAQLQAVRDGKMHGFLRMYWAKKILEWTESPEDALKIALYLNDKFNVDGRDPNGFVGVGWSIMGIHDMGWKEREVFGKIRFMNYAGCKRK